MLGPRARVSPARPLSGKVAPVPQRVLTLCLEARTELVKTKLPEQAEKEPAQKLAMAQPEQDDCRLLREAAATVETVAMDVQAQAREMAQPKAPLRSLLLVLLKRLACAPAE